MAEVAEAEERPRMNRFALDEEIATADVLLVLWKRTVMQNMMLFETVVVMVAVVVAPLDGDLMAVGVWCVERTVVVDAKKTGVEVDDIGTMMWTRLTVGQFGDVAEEDRLAVLTQEEEENRRVVLTREEEVNPEGVIEGLRVNVVEENAEAEVSVTAEIWEVLWQEVGEGEQLK